jgi:HK97 family phage prohead protease
MTMETRAFNLTDADLKGRHFRGRAVAYGHPSPLPTITGETIHESIQRGVFSETSVPLFREHQPALLLARNSVRLTHGDSLDVEAELLETAAAEEARALVEADELRGLSIGFLPAANGFHWQRRGSEVHRTLTAGRLIEVSLVAIPAYEGTSASVRSIAIPQDLPPASGGRDIARWTRYLAARA